MKREGGADRGEVEGLQRVELCCQGHIDFDPIGCFLWNVAQERDLLLEQRLHKMTITSAVGACGCCKSLA